MALDVAGLAAELEHRLGPADAALAAQYAGERPGRQPVHTVYVPADRYDETIVPRWRAEALRVLESLAGDHSRAADAFGLPEQTVVEVYDRMLAKLESEPVEDLRIDFEDGYGVRDDAQEDAAVDAAAAALLRSMDTGEATPFSGIRFKSFEAPTRARGLRTLARFTEAVTRDGALPEGFVVTLPKVTSVDQVSAMALACQRIEDGLGLRTGALGFEIQVETPQAICGPDGTALVARMIHASDARCTALHYGTYDYSASCGIAAAYQSMEHPAADHAKAVMQVASAGTGVRLSDGSTNLLPVGDPLQVRTGWRLHARLVRRSLERGFYQGWDLHPAQLPSRYLATFAFYREGLPAAAERLRNYVGRVESGVLDEPATARALADFVARGIDCGATDVAEVRALTGLDRAAIGRLRQR